MIQDLFNESTQGHLNKRNDYGALAVDLNGDGDPDIASIAYFGFKDLHIWRNDNAKNTDVH